MALLLRVDLSSSSLIDLSFGLKMIILGELNPKVGLLDLEGLKMLILLKGILVIFGFSSFVKYFEMSIIFTGFSLLFSFLYSNFFVEDTFVVDCEVVVEVELVVVDKVVVVGKVVVGRGVVVGKVVVVAKVVVCKFCGMNTEFFPTFLILDVFISVFTSIVFSFFSFTCSCLSSPVFTCALSERTLGLALAPSFSNVFICASFNPITLALTLGLVGGVIAPSRGERMSVSLMLTLQRHLSSGHSYSQHSLQHHMSI